MQLTVGYHRLEGKLVALKKPLAILRKVDAEAGASANEAGEAVEYEVVGVIRAKWHFKTRPRALITAPEAGKRPKAAQSNAALFFACAGKLRKDC